MGEKFNPEWLLNDVNHNRHNINDVHTPDAIAINIRNALTNFVSIYKILNILTKTGACKVLYTVYKGCFWFTITLTVTNKQKCVNMVMYLFTVYIMLCQCFHFQNNIDH